VVGECDDKELGKLTVKLCVLENDSKHWKW